MHDDFQRVNKKKTRKQKINFGREKEVSDFDDYSTVNQKLGKALDEFESSRFCFEILQSIDNCLESLHADSVHEVLCYGIGKFSGNKSSLHQLAALKVLHKHYQSSVTVYDPVLDITELKILNELKFNVLIENEEGKRKILDNKITLVFLPHCPKQLTNNFLWANWGINVKNCILIANSFSRIIEDNTKKVLQDSANYILQIYSKTKEISLENSYPIENIFNDISIHIFNSTDLTESFFTSTLDAEPIYTGETELIEKIKNLEIKNE